MRYIATCKMGLESTVAMQLKQLNATDVSAYDARVYFEGDAELLARALLWLRTAERVLLILGEFSAKSFEELFENTKQVPWKEYLLRNSNIHVNGKSAKSTLFSVSDCQSIVKKAIVENLKTAYQTNILPETGKEIIIEVGILKDEVTIAIDCCGAGLARRGYRTYNVAAPLSETLGAGIVLLSQFHKTRTLYDPMCGSGTMPIEAAMIAKRIAPGMHRSFSAEDLHFLPRGIWEMAREQARDSVSSEPFEIVGSDMDERSIALCKIHAKKAGIMAKWELRPVKELDLPKAAGVIVCNPPYGERMLSAQDVDNLYRSMRSVFDRADTYQVNVISAHRNFEKVYGKRADKRRKLSNGGLPCTLYQYYPPRGE